MISDRNTRNEGYFTLGKGCLKESELAHWYVDSTRQERGLTHKRQRQGFQGRIRDTKTSTPRTVREIPNGATQPYCKNNVLGGVSLLNSISKRIDTTAK